MKQYTFKLNSWLFLTVWAISEPAARQAILNMGATRIHQN